MDTLIIPFELSSINNKEIRKSYEKQYNVYYFILNLVTKQVGDPNNFTHKILLNPKKKYLFIDEGNDEFNNLTYIIGLNDVNCLNDYVKKNVLYVVRDNKGDWRVNKLVEVVKLCPDCCWYYFKHKPDCCCF